MSEHPHPAVFPEGDADTAPFWAAIARQEFLLPFCDDCGRASFFPRVLCPHCHGVALRWRAASGRGEVYSYTVAHRAAPAFADRTPFTVGLVDLEEGPRIMAELSTEAGPVRIGDRVRIRFRGTSQDPELFCFERAT